MLAFEEARDRVLNASSPLEPEDVPLDEAANRVLAEDVRAEGPLPPFDSSAMDGFAVRSTELGGEPPFELMIRGEARAGGLPVVLTPGTAARIFTGAELPSGADAVVIQENTTFTSDRVTIHTRAEPFENVRRAGEDLAAGAVALARGTRLGAFHLGLLAALDRAHVAVYRRPRLALLSTGDELRPPGSPRRQGTIPDSNSVAIRALAAQAGAQPVGGEHVPDEIGAAANVIAALARGADVLVTLGGASVGDHDIVRAALTRAGATVSFWKVALKPGKPFTFGHLGGTLVLGLPGNPVSAQVTFALFGMPLLRALQGERDPLPPLETVVLDTAVRQRPGRLGVYRARLHGRRASLARNQSSGSAVSLSVADALVFVPADASECAPGTELRAIRLRDL